MVISEVHQHLMFLYGNRVFWMEVKPKPWAIKVSFSFPVGGKQVSVWKRSIHMHAGGDISPTGIIHFVNS